MSLPWSVANLTIAAKKVLEDAYADTTGAKLSNLSNPSTAKAEVAREIDTTDPASDWGNRGVVAINDPFHGVIQLVDMLDFKVLAKCSRVGNPAPI
jgi:hypothetical protein